MKLHLATALLCVGALSGCGPSPKPPPVLNLAIVGAASQNPDGTGAAQPVALRVYQLSATAKFEAADVFALKDREAATLGTESAGSQEILVAPGEKKTVKIDLKPMVSSIGVAAMFQNIDAAAWRATQPAAANGPTDLVAKIDTLAVTLTPANGAAPAEEKKADKKKKKAKAEDAADDDTEIDLPDTSGKPSLGGAKLPSSGFKMPSFSK